MKRFSDFIVEGTDAVAAFEKAKRVAPFIKNNRYREMYLDSLSNLIIASQDKEIYNARFSENRTRVIRGIEYAYENFFDGIKDELIKDGKETIDLWDITTVNDIKKVAKIYDKYNHASGIKFMDSIREIPDSLKTVKSYVKSGRPPAKPKPGQFVKPMASNAAKKLAKEFMTDATETFSKKLRDDTTKQIMDAYEAVKQITDPKKLPKTPSEKVVASTIFVVKNNKLELIPNHETRLQRLIDDNVNEIIDGFISKNASKLALILQKKDRPKSHKIGYTNIRNGKVENSMTFAFNDRSEFTLQSSVVYKYSNAGKMFFQYPTRFTNVVMPDGSKMQGPSEEKMIKEF